MSAIPQSNLAAVILAGGRSSRMGRDKALLVVGGIPLLTRICTAAQTCASPVYVISPWVGRYQPLLPAGCQPLREVPLPEETVPHGPLVAFAQALPLISQEWILLLACDLPNLTAAALQQWCHHLAGGSENAIALLPRQAKGWEPLCGFYRQTCLTSLQPFIQQGGRSFQSWLAQQAVQELPVSDYQLLFNCNTPKDLAQYEL